MRKLLLLSVSLVGLATVLSSCGKNKSTTTGWAYNEKKNGGFQVVQGVEQFAGPGLVFVEGGTFVMGSTEQDLTYDFDNMERRVSVSSFYMDETEVRNVDWLEYLYWLTRVYKDYPEVAKKALPDTLVWRNPLSYNEPYTIYYLRHPAYKDYPVVGVSWIQATEFAAWRTDRVNEQLLIDKGILKINPNQINSDNFNAEAYLLGKYEGLVKKNLPNLDPNGTAKDRAVRLTDGILLPDYRLPTEAEWEYASYALRGNSFFENVNGKKTYPWNGLSTRDPEANAQGLMLANYKRGRGDNMGVAGFLNDNADVTAPVKSYVPNDFGLYCMAGNVNEWVMDVYRPLSYEDITDFNPYRGNVYKKVSRDADGNLAEKDSLGRIKKVVDADKYANPDKISEGDDEAGYDYGKSSLVNNRARIYKGGSWNDRAYWMTPGSRRFLDEEESRADIGFRCAMIRLGSPDGIAPKSAKPESNAKVRRQYKIKRRN